MDLIPQIMQRLYQLRQERLPLMETYLDTSDPDLMDKLVADAINALENLFIFMNLPKDGFVPNISKED